MSSQTRNATERFSDRAAAYSAHRPGYPAQVFDALFEGLGNPRDLIVADVGAGTGISTGLLAERVRHVYAIEPNEQMRQQAAVRSNVTWSAGTGERTELGDKSVDVAVAFQAYHWFDPDLAFEELTRVARRRFALVQYERDEGQAFSAAYARAIRPYMLDDTEALRFRTLEDFPRRAGARLRRAVVASAQILTLGGVLGRVASSSYLPQTGERAEQLRSRVRGLFEEMQRRGTVEMAMSVYVLAVDTDG